MGTNGATCRFDLSFSKWHRAKRRRSVCFGCVDRELRERSGQVPDASVVAQGVKRVRTSFRVASYRNPFPTRQPAATEPVGVLIWKSNDQNSSSTEVGRRGVSIEILDHLVGGGLDCRLPLCFAELLRESPGLIREDDAT